MKTLGAFGLMFAQVFNKQITQSLINFKNNQTIAQQNIDNLKLREQSINAGIGEGAKSNEEKATLEALKEELKIAEQIKEVEKGISQEEFNKLQSLQQQVGQLKEQETLETLNAKDKGSKILGEDKTNQLLEMDIPDAKVEVLTYEGVVEDQEEILKNKNEELRLTEKSLNGIKFETEGQKELEKRKKAILKIAEKLDEDTQRQVESSLELIKSEHFLKVEKEEILKLLDKEAQKSSEAGENRLKALKKEEEQLKKNLVQETQGRKNAVYLKGQKEQFVNNSKEQVSFIQNQLDTIFNKENISGQAVGGHKSQISIKLNELEANKAITAEQKQQIQNQLALIKSDNLSKQSKKEIEKILKGINSDLDKSLEKEDQKIADIDDRIKDINAKLEKNKKQSDEIVEDEVKKLEAIDKQKSKVEKLLNLDNKGLLNAEATQKVKKEILDIVQQLEFEGKKELIQDLEETNNQKDIKEIKEKVLEILRDEIKAQEEVVQKAKDEAKTANEILESNKKIEELRRGQKGAAYEFGERFKKDLKNLDTEKLIKGFSSAASSVSMVYGTISSISST